MAHNNINERRAFVTALLEKGTIISGTLRKSIADQFSCSPAAIAADLIALRLVPGTPSIHCTPSLRKLIASRDHVCQYCGQTSASLIVEHVIPAALGGPARAYNLVLACQKCNVTKGRSVWIPNNLDSITAEHPEWRERIVNAAKH
jgi:hypothetical protein